MPKADRLQAHAIADAKLQDTLTEGFVRELDAALADLNRQIRRLVLSLETKGGRLVSTQANLGRALRLRTEIRQAMTAAGFADLATSSVDESLDKLASSVLKGKSIAAEAARLTPVQVDTLAAYKSLHLADLMELADDSATALQRTLLNGVMGSRNLADLLDDTEAMLLGERARRLKAGRRPTRMSLRQEARTIYDTALGTYGRQVQQIGTTGEPDELFFYSGPADRAMRPFCRERVGKVFARGQISEMTNGQIPNVMLTCGGWNCRHQLVAISDLDAELQQLADTGERLPSVATQVGTTE